MKYLLPAMLIGASTAYAGVESSFTHPHYFLLYPKATLETDAGGRCTRLTNLSNELVYIPLTEQIAQVANALPRILEVKGCARR